MPTLTTDLSSTLSAGTRPAATLGSAGSSVRPIAAKPVDELSAMNGSNSETDVADESVTPERISKLAIEVAAKTEKAIVEIGKLNDETKFLSINAQIEAARAGGRVGAAFGVVASSIQDLSRRTAEVARYLANETKGTVAELQHVNKLLSTHYRGQRLSDIAFTNVDLIDRNLYERSCDCRWWATDAAFVSALQTHDPAAARFACQRMEVILRAYTVYFDLVLCDLTGKVIANGRPAEFSSIGSPQGGSEWFRSALSRRSGDEFGFESVHASQLANGKRVLVYSCTVRKDGRSNGEVLGVLGLVFRWDALAQTIVENAPLLPSERNNSRVCITTRDGKILADSWGKQLHDTLDFPERSKLFSGTRNYVITTYNQHPACIAHAVSEGFEGYSTGWHSVVVQLLDT